MKRLGLSCYALAMGAASAMLAGCGGSQPPIGAPGAMQAVGKNSARHRAPRYAVLFSFDETDGASPSGGLLNVEGTLYETTSTGGVSHYGCRTSTSCERIAQVQRQSRRRYALQ